MTEGLVFGSRNIRALCKRFRVEGRGRGHAVVNINYIGCEMMNTYVLVKTNDNRRREFWHVSRRSY